MFYAVHLAVLGIVARCKKARTEVREREQYP
jgi:hypothetical protein